jgi:hypothetical protein
MPSLDGAAGLVSAVVNSHYGTERAAQIEYAPLGVPTGLCAALATSAYQNEGLSLQPRSTPGTTVWIIDTAGDRARPLSVSQRLDHGLHSSVRHDHPR